MMCSDADLKEMKLPMGPRKKLMGHLKKFDQVAVRLEGSSCSLENEPVFLFKRKHALNSTLYAECSAEKHSVPLFKSFGMNRSEIKP